MMKKEIFTLLIFFGCLGTQAQKNDPLTLSIAIGTGIDLSTPASTPFSCQTTGNYKLHPRFSLGIGTGLSFTPKMLIPVFANLKFDLTKPAKFTPFIAWDAGYSFAPSKNTSGGLYFHPSLGLDYAIHSDHTLFMALGYEIQKLESIKTASNSFFTTEYIEKLNHQWISLRIGFAF